MSDDTVTITMRREVADRARGWLTWCSYQGTPPSSREHDMAAEAAKAIEAAMSEKRASDA